MTPKTASSLTAVVMALLLISIWYTGMSKQTTAYTDETASNSDHAEYSSQRSLLRQVLSSFSSDQQTGQLKPASRTRQPFEDGLPPSFSDRMLARSYVDDDNVHSIYTSTSDMTEIRSVATKVSDCLSLTENGASTTSCQKSSSSQRLSLSSKGLIRHAASNYCLSSKKPTKRLKGTSTIVVEKCDEAKLQQQWTHEGPGFHRAGILRSKAHPTHCLQRRPPSGLVLAPCSSSCQDLWLVGVKHQGHQSLQSEAPRMMYNHRVKNTGLRIACFVLTHPKNHATKARLINTTWGTRCNHLVFISTEPIPDMNTAVLQLDSPDSRQHLRTKGKFAYMHMYEHYLDKADWFLRADDDTYMIMENVKTYLETFSPHHLVVLGRRFFNNGKRQEPFNAGGPGVILSHAGMKLLGEKTKAGMKWAPPEFGQGQDQQVGFTLTSLGVEVVDTRGAHGRHRFHPLHINIEHEGKASNPESDYWFNKFAPDTLGGHDCCVEDWLGSHYTRLCDFLAWDSMETSGCTNKPIDSPYLRLPLMLANQTVSNLGFDAWLD